jgi:SAM-dependent methyltransferase
VEWKRWGEIDPLYGVAAAKGRQRGGPRPWSDSEFYELGSRHWARFHPTWRRYGLDYASCLEIGCGAGRMTAQLAREFGIVHAADVSRGMIDYAAARVTATNVRFQLTDGEKLPLEAASVTAVFSTHVFQHFDSLDQATVSFREVARVLAPSGTIMIHLPIYRWPSGRQGFEFLYSLRKAIGDIRAQVMRPLIARGFARPLMRYLGYPAQYVFQTLPVLGFTDPEIVILAAADGADLHPFVLARRAPIGTESSSAVGL